MQLKWQLVPGYSAIGDGVGPWLYSLLLPTVALGLTYVALIPRMTRATMLEALGEDYMRTARAKGIAADLYS